ncbi:uncharacterized protein DMAD_08507 [Drosophila madeirensis]|uniref:Uncharacterized protein n=3 Tax=Drosophila madeirensis TaxID=30013 RepID=A0AAU9F7T9_DROMD
MNSAHKPPSAAAKLLNLNVTNEEEEEVEEEILQQKQQQQEESILSPEETQLLLQRLRINNPFYRFRKQSNSLKELRRVKRRTQGQDTRSRSRSEADLGKKVPQSMPQKPHQHNEAKVVVVLDSKQQQEVAISQNRYSSSNASLKTRSVSSLTASQGANESSTVITNPFSIFHDDEILTLSVNTRLRSAASARSARPQRTGRGLRRLFESPRPNANPPDHHYLHGVPVRRFERQDFDQDHERRTTTGKAKRSKAIFKQLSLRKLHHRSEDPPSLPKLKLSYPNRTHSIQSMRAAGSGGYDIQHTAYHPRLQTQAPVNNTSSTAAKANYFERLQAKTRQGIQKIRDKCRNFKTSSGSDAGSGSEFSGFHTLAKDESFRFISDRTHISNYESRCKQATIYKSYKSEIDLSKNLHYLDAYLEENFDQHLSTTKQSAHSVGRVSGAQRRALATQPHHADPHPHPMPETPRRRHKRSQSQANNGGLPANYENLGTLPIASKATRRTAAPNSDSMSSSDYASVFSGPTTAKRERELPPPPPQLEALPQAVEESRESKEFKLRYEHPDKMCEYYFDNLTSYALALEESEDLLLAESAKSARFFYGDDDDDDEDDEDDDDEDAVRVVAAGMAAAAACGEPDYTARDIRIRVSVNECEDADWQQPTTYNENLAESTFYQSLNQHLQRQQQQQHQQASRVEDEEDEHPQNENHEADHLLLVGAAGAGGESYLDHFQRQRGRNEFERALSSSQHYPRADYYGFGRGADVGTDEAVYATKQRRADLMEAHYARSYQGEVRGGGGGPGRSSKPAATRYGLEMERRQPPMAGAVAGGGATGGATAMPATTGSVINLALPQGQGMALGLGLGLGGDALYATSSKQQITMTPTAASAAVALSGAAVSSAMPQFHPTATAAAAPPPPTAAAALGGAAGGTAGTGNANNRYMLENLRKYYANQQQHPPAHSVNSSSLSNSSSSNSSMSQQQLKLNLNLPKQQQHLVPRRNSSTSNASSTAENFDTFITLRNATANTSTDYLSKQQMQRRAQQQSVPLTSALNYYGHGPPTPTPSLTPAVAYNGKLTATAMLSQVNLSRAAATQQGTGTAATSASLLPHQHQQHARATAKPVTASGVVPGPGAGGESFILEYEC